jgi:hypothetical protein
LHLKEVAREFYICEFVEGFAIESFYPKDIFVAHLTFMGYANLFEIFMPQEIEGKKSPYMVINNNVNKLNHSKSKTM